MLRDEDIDQPYPRNIDDQDLLSTELPEDLPQHGNLEASVAHAKLAKIMGHNSDFLYPVRNLSQTEIFDRTSTMLDVLEQWKTDLPDFLRPRDKTLAGQRTFERQNTVLKLAYCHLLILITRRCLSVNSSQLGHDISSRLDDRAVRPIEECKKGIDMTLNTIRHLIERGVLYQASWFTQYVALVAISTLYVYIIQQLKTVSQQGQSKENERLFFQASRCQAFLARLAPEGSQAYRHYRLLERLRKRAELSIARQRPSGQHVQGISAQPSQTANDLSSSYVGAMKTATAPGAQAQPHHLQENPTPSFYSPSINVDNFLPEPVFSAEDDRLFNELLELGWENLDTVGLLTDSEQYSLQP
jgi:hypothetical protein